MVDYKDTLNILKTNFEMRANLHTKEPLIQKEWLDNHIYQEVLKKNKNGKHWTLHDGPPYANGNIHVGHALNKIIKDIIVRYHNMLGQYSNYIPGWDTHGLPIEHALLKTGANKDPNLSISQKRDNCKNFAIKYINLQKEQFARLGLLTDFKDIYYTYDNQYEGRQLNLLLEAIKQKLIYQDLKPVYWSWSSQSALADGEIEYADMRSPSIYVIFNIITSNDVVKANDKIIIWTTTPWTLPSNLATAVNPKFTYVKFSYNGQNYIVSKARVSELTKTLEWKDVKIISEFSGTKLENVLYQHPLYDKKCPIILAEYVSNENGTGLVHNAPGFGTDDYLACKKYNIHPFAPIDQLGKFTSEVNDKELEGLFYDDTNKIITKRLENNKSLLKLEFITHSAAIDWRTKKPVIYRASKQWFIDIKKLQPQLLSALEKVSFKNNQHRKHIVDMIENRVEWCISRQRIWGVPIPIIFDENNNPLFDVELIENTIDIITKEGTNAWFEKPAEYFLTKKYLANPVYKKYTKEKDTMDVWFDSGTSFTLLKVVGLDYPADLYFEGNDQYRGWFNSSLINGVILTNSAPFKMLLSHGMVLDEQGRKMSKSIGNVVDPLQVCQKFGADILRMWAANTNFQIDVRISDGILEQTSEMYRRIRNSLFKFCLANTSDFNYEKDHNNDFNEVDLFVLSQLKTNIDLVNKSYENYDFLNVIKIINNHVIELSSWYFDLIKDTLYCEKADSKARRSIQTVLYLVLKSYLVLLTPIIPHTCDETYKQLNVANKQKSIALEDWVKEIKVDTSSVINDKWAYFYQIKDVVYAELEKLRNEKIINKNNQALVELSFNNQYSFNEQLLAKYLNVAKVKFISTDANKILAKVSDAKFIKCERCWNYYEPNHMHDEHICNRCYEVIKNK